MKHEKPSRSNFLPTNIKIMRENFCPWEMPELYSKYRIVVLLLTINKILQFEAEFAMHLVYISLTLCLITYLISESHTSYPTSTQPIDTEKYVVPSKCQTLFNMNSKYPSGYECSSRTQLPYPPLTTSFDVE